MSGPEVTVVVATRDRATRLRALLASLRAQTLDSKRFEVVVVDDGSRDDTAAVLGAERDGSGLSLTWIAGSGGGPAVARNLGWRAGTAPLVAFTDDDCEAAPGWLEALLACPGTHPDAIVQGPTRPIGRELAGSGAYPRTRLIEAPGPWYETCNILYPRELLERLNGFDETLPEALGEDTDLGWRARELGAELVWCGGAEVEHAVEDLSPVGFVRSALVGADAVAVYKRHPDLRRETLALGVIRNPALPRLALALVGVALAGRRPAALALAVPWARNLVGRVRVNGGGPAAIPVYAAHDVVAGFTSLRGSRRHRTLVL